MSDFPWEVNSKNFNKFFEGPYLFAALYKVYRGAYYGQGFQFNNISPIITIKFIQKFESLPIEIKRTILAKIWNNGKGFNLLGVFKGEILLSLELQFLFIQYKKLRQLTEPLISGGCGAWNGYKLSKTCLIFEYGEQKYKSKILIPNFLCQDLVAPMTNTFGMICL